MDYYLLDFSKEHNYTFDNVIIGKKISYLSLDNVHKYNIYYCDDFTKSPKSMYIKVPKIRLIYKLGQNNYSQEKIVLYPNYDLLQIFINFIKEFEDNISSCIKNKYLNLELNSILIKNSNNNYSLKLNIDNNIKISSTLNKNINLSEFKINNEVELVIKFNHIWIKDNKFGINCNIYQIKYYASPQELNVDFLDNDNNIPSNNSPSNNIFNQNNIISNHNIISSTNNIISNNIANPVTNTIFNPVSNPVSNINNMPKMVPSIDALLNAKSKLKPLI